MTLPYLETFTLDFSQAQRQALEDLIQRSKDGLSIGLDEANALLEQIQAGTEPIFQKPTFALEILDACKLATAMESIRADLTTMYSELRGLETLANQHAEIHKNILGRLHQAVLKLDEMILVHKYRRLNLDYTDVKVNDFISAQNEATTPNRARVQPETGQLVTGIQRKNEYLIRTGAMRPKYTTEFLSDGLNPDRHVAFLPDNAARKSGAYVWAEVILADSTLRGVYDGTQYNGAVVKLDIELPQLEEMNELKLAPFGRFPLTLVAAEYLDGDDWIGIPSVTVPLRLELDTTAIRFPTISARTVRLVFQKEDYRLSHIALERGQVKRSNWLNIMLQGSLEASVNDQSILPYALRDDRRDRARDALDQKLLDIETQEPLDRYVEAISQVVDVNDRSVIKLTKNEYVVGLKVLELNYVRYVDEGDYISPPYQAFGSVYKIRCETVEAHQQFNDGVADANITSIQHWIDIGGGREIPLLPEASVRISSERLYFDANRVARSRFNVASVPDAVVRRDGQRLSAGSEYSIVTTAGNRAVVTILRSAWRPASKYSISYNPEAGQDEIDILSLFDSVKPTQTEEYVRTERDNRVALRAHPFVLREIPQDKRRWSRPDPNDARWMYRGPASRAAATDDPYVIRIDGENYGTHPEVTVAVANMLVGDVHVDLNFTAGGNVSGAMPAEGTIRIGDELVYYTTYTVTGTGTARLTGLVRGYRNTAEAQHNIGATVRWVTEEAYEPVIVKVNGARCRNRTDYLEGRNPAFTDEEGPPEFVQIGSTLYFDRPIHGRIEVWYRRLADKLVLKSKLFCDHPSKEFTPVLDCAVLKLKTSTL